MDTTEPRAFAAAGTAEPVQAEAPEITALVERAKTGDADAFAGLMRLYERRIISIGVQMGLSRDDALDACQDSFVKVFRYIGRFRSGESFFKWLYRIAVNAIHDHHRRSRPAALVSIEEAFVTREMKHPEPGTSLETRVESSDLARKLLKGMGCLSRQERIVFVLRDLQGIDTAQIGRILRLSQITVRRHCSSARQKLRDRLSASDH